MVAAVCVWCVGSASVQLPRLTGRLAAEPAQGGAGGAAPRLRQIHGQHRQTAPIRGPTGNYCCMLLHSCTSTHFVTQAMKRNYSKEDFVWILGNLSLATGWLTIGIHYLHSMLIAAPLTRLRSIFQFSRSQNPIIILNKCDM